MQSSLINPSFDLQNFMRRRRNESGVIGGGPSLDLISMVERYVHGTPIDYNERVYFDNFDLKLIALGSEKISENTALHKILDDFSYTMFYIYSYDDIDWVDDYSEFVEYVVEMFGYMRLPVPREFNRKSSEGILAARDQHRDYFISGLKFFVESAFAHLWARKQFLFDFNLCLSKQIAPLLKKEYPILAKDGQLHRATYFPVWLKNLIVHRERGLCHYCGCVVASPSMPNQDYDIDHMVPIASGGTNDPTNLVLACPKCNNDKRAKFRFVPDTFAWPTRTL